MYVRTRGAPVAEAQSAFVSILLNYPTAFLLTTALAASWRVLARPPTVCGTRAGRCHAQSVLGAVGWPWPAYAGVSQALLEFCLQFAAPAFGSLIPRWCSLPEQPGQALSTHAARHTHPGIFKTSSHRF